MYKNVGFEIITEQEHDYLMLLNLNCSAGWRRTIGLKSDGTVVVVGDNEYGQCDVNNSFKAAMASILKDLLDYYLH